MQNIFKEYIQIARTIPHVKDRLDDITVAWYLAQLIAINVHATYMIKWNINLRPSWQVKSGTYFWMQMMEDKNNLKHIPFTNNNSCILCETRIISFRAQSARPQRKLSLARILQQGNLRPDYIKIDVADDDITRPVRGRQLALSTAEHYLMCFYECLRWSLFFRIRVLARCIFPGSGFHRWTNTNDNKGQNRIFPIGLDKCHLPVRETQWWDTIGDGRCCNGVTKPIIWCFCNPWWTNYQCSNGIYWYHCVRYTRANNTLLKAYTHFIHHKCPITVLSKWNWE